MEVFLLKSKVHRATVTGGDVNYEGSLTISADLMEKCGLQEYEKILCGNMANGHRWETYAIKGKPGAGEIMGVKHRTLPVWGVQFHPESILTESGRTVLKNFLKLK